MNKYLKYGLAALAGTGFLIISLIVATSLLLNPNDYKPQIVQMVKEKNQRALTLAGDIKLAFFPKLGLDLGRVSLSEFKGEKEFAAVESARLYLSWWPLLRKKMVVDQIRIQGVTATLVRLKDGTTNFDDLLKKNEDSEDKQINFDINSISITKSAFTLQDKKAGRQFALSDISLKTGRLTSGKPTEASADFVLKGEAPRVEAQVHLTAGLTFDTEAKRFAVNGLNLEITGEAAGLSKLSAGLKGNIELDRTADTLLMENLLMVVSGKNGTDDIDIKLTAPRLQWVAGKIATDAIKLETKMKQNGEAKGEMVLLANIPSVSGDSQSFKTSKVTVDLNAKQPDGKYQGQVTSALSGNFDDQQFALANIKGTLTGNNTKMSDGAMQIDLAGSAQLDLQDQSATLNLTSHLNESTIKLRGGITQFAKPRITLDLDLDKIDADRYLPPQKPRNPSQPEKALDFSILKTLNANGNIQVGSLTLYNIKASNVRLDFKAGGGQLDIRPLSADLYQGTMSGALSLNAEGPKITARQNISGVSINPLLKDALNKDILEGRGSLNFDLRAEGTTVGSMKKSLQGKASLNLRDGAVKGINIPAGLREAQSVLGTLTGKKVQAANVQEKTEFSELSASFAINRGVAHNKDLFAKSPLLRVSGNGDIDIGADMINYLVRATVVGSLEGLRGRELASLKGVTVPVRVTGPLAAAEVTLDFNGLVGESIQQGIKTRATDTLKEGFKGLFR